MLPVDVLPPSAFTTSVQTKTCRLSSPPCPSLPPLLSISSGTQCVLWRLPAILIRMSEINIYIKLYICNNLTWFMWVLFQIWILIRMTELLLNGLVVVECNSSSKWAFTFSAALYFYSIAFESNILYYALVRSYFSDFRFYIEKHTIGIYKI